MFLLLVRILAALPLDASQPGSGFTISCGVSPVPPLLSRRIVAGPTTPSSHTRQTARIEDRMCRTRDEMQALVGGGLARSLCTCTRRPTHPLWRMPRIDECLGMLRFGRADEDRRRVESPSCDPPLGFQPYISGGLFSAVLCRIL